MRSATIKSKRIASGIPGDILCRKIGRSRSWLSAVERGYVSPSADELMRIDAALDTLVRAKSAMRQAAIESGWPATTELA